MKRILRYFVAIIFIVSGLVKTIDTKGFSFKLEEYFSPEVFNISFLEHYALPIAIFISLLEVILGLMLLIKIKFKKTLISLISLCVFFAFLTFYSAYFNVVTDCGCFGDAIKFTPWQSFWKDMFLLVVLLFLWQKNKHCFGEIRFKWIKKILLSIGIFITIYITYHGVFNEPLIDFRDYKIGTDIGIEKMKLEKNPSEYKTFYTLKNKKTKTEKEVNQDDYINNEIYWKEGSEWEIQENKTITKLIKKGYESEIAKFNLVDENGEDQTMTILNLPKVILICSYKPLALNSEDFQLIKEKFGKQNNIYGISNKPNVFPYIPNLQIDATALKAVGRSNPFVLILEKGKIIDKKSLKDI